MGKTELYQRMVGSFCRSAADLAAQLEAWLAASMCTEAQSALHTFKGLAAKLGADSLAVLSAEVEAMLKRQELADRAWRAGFALRLQADTQELTRLAQAISEVGLRSGRLQSPDSGQ